MAGPVTDSLLPDLSDVSLDDLLGIDNPVLLEALRRVQAEADNPQEIVAGFNSAI